MPHPSPSVTSAPCADGHDNDNANANALRALLLTDVGFSILTNIGPVTRKVLHKVLPRLLLQGNVETWHLDVEEVIRFLAQTGDRGKATATQFFAQKHASAIVQAIKRMNPVDFTELCACAKQSLPATLQERLVAAYLVEGNQLFWEDTKLHIPPTTSHAGRRHVLDRMAQASIIFCIQPYLQQPERPVVRGAPPILDLKTQFVAPCALPSDTGNWADFHILGGYLDICSGNLTVYWAACDAFCGADFAADIHVLQFPNNKNEDGRPAPTFLVATRDVFERLGLGSRLNKEGAITLMDTRGVGVAEGLQALLMLLGEYLKGGKDQAYHLCRFPNDLSKVLTPGGPLQLFLDATREAVWRVVARGTPLPSLEHLTDLLSGSTAEQQEAHRAALLAYLPMLSPNQWEEVKAHLKFDFSDLVFQLHARAYQQRNRKRKANALR